MIDNKTTKIAGLIVAVLVLGYFSIWGRGSVELKFVELSSPKGFRTLILETQSSGPNALFGLSSQNTVKSSPSGQAFCDMLFRDDSSPVLGPKHAKVSIVEFFDYRCPYCRTLTEILFQLQEERGVRIIYKEWPILSEGSKLAARAALGAAVQSKYQEFHSRFMNARLLTTNAYIKSMAADHDIDPVKLFRDMNGPQITAALKRNAIVASELGIVGTPSLVVGRTIVQGAITREQLEQLIDIETKTPPSKVC